MKKWLLLTVSVACIVSLASIVRSGIGGRQMQLLQGHDEGLSAKSYVQEGLVNQWDGIENVAYLVHDDSATTWIDLVGRVSMNRVLFGESYAIPSGSTRTFGFYITGDFTLHACLVNGPIFWGNWAEIGIGVGSGIENGIVLAARGGSSPNYSVCYRMAYSGTVYASVPTGTINGEKFSIDIMFQYSSKTYWVYVDGELVGNATIPEENWNLDGVSCAVGFGVFYNYSNLEDFKVFNYMLYDRMLSQEEIEMNSKIDKERFFVE